MYRIVVVCSGVSVAAGNAAVADVLDEFANRPWHIDVSCRYDGGLLVLEATNDYDTDGTALLDEFSDAVCACTPIESTDISFQVRKVRPVGEV